MVTMRESLASVLLKSLLVLLIFFSLTMRKLALASGDSKKVPDANQLLKDSDRARGTAQATKGISWKAHIHSEDNGNLSDIEYLIKVRGDNAIAEALSPARNKGQITLFNNRNVWFYKLGLKKPIAISPRQKLSGQAANGDIASTNYARDYLGTIVSEESIDGIETYKLLLKAQAKDVTYDQIIYWVSKDKHLAVKADYLTVNGDVFKRAQFVYEERLLIKEKTIPFVSKMTIRDAKNPKNFTVLTYQDPHEENHSLNIFNVNNIIR